MLADHVKCNWCDTESFIPIGDEICPNCKKEGYLQWIDEDNPEVETDKFKIINKYKGEINIYGNNFKNK